MVDEAALIETIRAQPADWGRKLVYADWLEDQGDPRAEMIRVAYLMHRGRRRRCKHPNGESEEGCLWCELVHRYYSAWYRAVKWRCVPLGVWAYEFAPEAGTCPTALRTSGER